MSANTKIEWSDDSWNPIRARHRASGKQGWHCETVSEGCRNCYAASLNHNRFGTGLPYKPGHRDDIELYLDEKALLAPLKRRKGRRIFVCSMTDLFADFVPKAWIDRIFAVMALSPQHIFQVLTKRSARMRDYLRERAGDWSIVWPDANPPGSLPISRHAQRQAMRGAGWPDAILRPTFPLPNIWLGVSVEDQAAAEARIPPLLETPAAIRWISAEPLLGPVDLTSAWHGESAVDLECWGDCAWCKKGHPPLWNCQHGRFSERDHWRMRSGLDWVVVGGESGNGARMWPGFEDAARAIQRQCAEAGVAFFMKQMQGTRKAAMPPIPDDLMVRKFPHAT